MKDGPATERADAGRGNSFRDQLCKAAERGQISLDLAQIEGLERYFGLLSRWNRKINLTALPLEGAPEATINRLFVEPLQAAARIENMPVHWFDLGSGGGSPAIPLKVVRPLLRLTMVESRSRKAAFLGEVVRFLELTDSNVLQARIEALAGSGQRHSADLVTLRAVRADEDVLRSTSDLLRAGGRFFIFGPKPTVDTARFGLEIVEELNSPLRESALHVFRKVA